MLLCFATVNLLFGTTKTWNAGSDGIWELASNWSPAGIPGSNDDVVIDTDFTVTVSTNRTVKSIELLAGGDLIVASSATLTVTNSSGKDGISLSVDSVATSLTVHGNIICTNHNKDGIDVNELGFIEVTSTGSIYVEDVSDDGFELSDNLTNSGTITIINVGGDGIYAKGDIEVPLRKLYNYGTITISDCDFAIDQKNHWIFENYGTVILSEAKDALIDDGSNFNNFGTFKGNGTVQNGNNYDVSFKPGSTLAPGLSPGKLTFTEQVNFSSITVQIEIEGASNYDQIVVDTGDHSAGSVLITGAILDLSGSYIPEGSEEFMILEKKSTGAITGTFAGYPEGSTVMFNGSSFTISYLGGDGNDMTMTNDFLLPVELIDFNARPMENEVKLAWATATEINNDFFTIERSKDGRTFNEIAKIAGNGNTTEISKYTFMDKNPENGVSYYRLKQTDFDGQFTYSEIEQIEFRSEEGLLKVYPTIVKEALTIETNGEDEQIGFVFDLDGKVLKSFNISKGELKKEIILGDLLPGNYFITIRNNNTFKTQKFVKL